MRRGRQIKECEKLARHVERAAVPERPFMGSGPRYLVQPSVTAACAPSLRAALKEVVRLECLIAGAATAIVDEEPVAVAV